MPYFRHFEDKVHFVRQMQRVVDEFTEKREAQAKAEAKNAEKDPSAFGQAWVAVRYADDVFYAAVECQMAARMISVSERYTEADEAKMPFVSMVYGWAVQQIEGGGGIGGSTSQFRNEESRVEHQFWVQVTRGCSEEVRMEYYSRRIAERDAERAERAAKEAEAKAAQAEFAAAEAARKKAERKARREARRAQ